MALINVNHTRMELKHLKARLKTAERGCKLLKDKTDEMIRRFSLLIKENKNLRDNVEKDISSVLLSFSKARSFMGEAEIKLSFSMPLNSVSIDCDTKYVLNLSVPSISVKENVMQEKYPYSFIGVTSEADYSVDLLNKTISKMVKLAEIEKTVFMLSLEIEKSKRRVNALEYVMIPNIIETINYISMKLEENERGSRTRLMKVKTMLEERG